ncbi:hypothetical protein EcWSU1_03986 [Enterobacter ludwigii]|uniref:Uncharacterized protein n=1 Tax=Enterobacter ludwigii TaxID=299767 RepID=G8LGD9_9ENTR|nr:hypothetical protein EcWSU1_03986 [Enterobacter ludwigii]
MLVDELDTFFVVFIPVVVPVFFLFHFQLFELLAVVVIPHEFDFFWLFRFFSLNNRVLDDKGHHIPAQIFHANLACRGDQVVFIFPAHRFSNGFRFRFRFGFIHQIDLVKDQPTRLVRQFFAVFFQLADNDAGIFYRIGTVDWIDIDEMQQYAAALKVFQEADTQTGTFCSTFNQTRDISNHKALLVIHTDNAQAWYQRGKRIIRHFWLGCRDRANKRRFTGVWHTQHPDIGQKHQLQLQIALVARRTHRFLTRGTVYGRFETAVTQTVPAAFRHHQTLTVFGHIAHGFARPLVNHTRTDRNLNGHVFTAFARTVTALTVLTTLSAEGFFETVVDQRVEVLIRLQPHVTAVPAVTAVRTATWNIFLTAEAHATIAAITCHDQDCRFINKLHFTLRNSFA